MRRVLLLAAAFPLASSLCITLQDTLDKFVLKLGEGECGCVTPNCTAVLSAGESACFGWLNTPDCHIPHGPTPTIGGGLGVASDYDQHKCHTFRQTWSGAGQINDGDQGDLCGRLANATITKEDDSTCKMPPCTTFRADVDTTCTVLPYQPCNGTDVCCADATCQPLTGSNAMACVPPPPPPSPPPAPPSSPPPPPSPWCAAPDHLLCGKNCCAGHGNAQCCNGQCCAPERDHIICYNGGCCNEFEPGCGGSGPG